MKGQNWLIAMATIGLISCTFASHIADDNSIEEDIETSWASAIAKLTAKQEIEPAKVEELLHLIDREAPEQKELNVKRLLGACVATDARCGQRDFLRREFYMFRESLFGYLEFCARKRRAHCGATFVARFNDALGQIDNQIKEDVGQLLTAWELPEEFYTQDGAFRRVPNNQIKALVGFTRAELGKNGPDSDRRYHTTTAFEELSVVAIEACKEFERKMKQTLGSLEVPEGIQLSDDQIKWIVGVQVCSVLEDQFGGTWILARNEFATWS